MRDRVILGPNSVALIFGKSQIWVLGDFEAASFMLNDRRLDHFEVPKIMVQYPKIESIGRTAIYTVPTNIPGSMRMTGGSAGAIHFLDRAVAWALAIYTNVKLIEPRQKELLTFSDRPKGRGSCIRLYCAQNPYMFILNLAPLSTILALAHMVAQSSIPQRLQVLSENILGAQGHATAIPFRPRYVEVCPKLPS